MLIVMSGMVSPTCFLGYWVTAHPEYNLWTSIFTPLVEVPFLALVATTTLVLVYMTIFLVRYGKNDPLQNVKTINFTLTPIYL